MGDKVYTLLDLAEEFGKDKQFIRRRISRLELSSINKDSREHTNEPLEYSRSTYLKLAEEFGISVVKKDNENEIREDTQSNTRETREDTRKKFEEDDKNRVIEVLERELKHSKDKLEKSEEEKETLMRLLDQQQRLSLQANQKIEMLENKEEIKEEENEKKKWWHIFTNNKDI